MEILLRLLLGRREGSHLPPPRGPRGFRARLPQEGLEEELGEGPGPEDEQDDGRPGYILGEVLVIRYVNASGRESCRRIALHAAYERNGVHYLRAYCFERSAPRTFRRDRIREIMDADTGEVFSSVDEILEAVADRAEPLDSREATQRVSSFKSRGFWRSCFWHAAMAGCIHLNSGCCWNSLTRPAEDRVSTRAMRLRGCGASTQTRSPTRAHCTGLPALTRRSSPASSATPSA